jgi:(p)ppGpp synthase/HD superfamily hydrolase
MEAPRERSSGSLTNRFADALAYAHRVHADQRRKGGSVPYIAHLLGVAALVLEDGGDEDEAIAALLHDAVEDQGGAERLDDIRRRFGERVAAIVEACTDTKEDPKPPWYQRKETHIEGFRSAPPEVLRIALADKLYNARAIQRDRYISGEAVWSRFHAGREQVLWYYRTLADLFSERRPGWMAEELQRVIQKLERPSG